MQEFKNNEVINSEVFEKKDEPGKVKQAMKNLAEGKSDSFRVAQFKPMDVVEVRGLRFNIISVESHTKTLKLRLQ